MFELVRAQCPACGAKLKVDSRKPMAQCEYCGQRSLLRASGAQPGPQPAVGSAPMMVIELPDVRRRLIFILLVTLMPIVLVAVIVFVVIYQVRQTVSDATAGIQIPGSSFIGARGGSNTDKDEDDKDNDKDKKSEDPPLPPVSDYLAAPHDIPERIRRSVVDPPEVRFVSIERSMVEAYPSDGQRHTISVTGLALRRGGARTVPTHTFDLTAIDFSIVPVIIAAASEISEFVPTRVVLQADDGTPQWIISIRKDGKVQKLRYALDGTPVAGEP